MKLTQPDKKDETFQLYILEHVSRTFALTIPQLPKPLDRTVSNAYLLCRIADTIEDDPALSFQEKHFFSEWFANLVKQDKPANQFAKELGLKLGATTTTAEKELVNRCESILNITHSLSKNERTAMLDCVEAMTRGMVKYQGQETLEGLENQKEMDLYCYYVAGVVGIMLTKLFLEYGESWNTEAKLEMEVKAISFGQGLQMTNIIKDFWTDRERGACWLPRSTFEPLGVSLKIIDKENITQFKEGIDQLVSITREHLVNALEYTILIPKKEKGIRMFCLWAILIATLTLSKIKNGPEFVQRRNVKISRKTVAFVIFFSNLCNGSNFLIRILFKLTALKI